MNRRVLLLEPNYKNKYPPMGLMKLAMYYRLQGDDVHFYKGDLNLFVLDELLDEVLPQLDKISDLSDSRIDWSSFAPEIRDFLRTGKIIPESSFEQCLNDNPLCFRKIKKYREYFKKGYYFETPKWDLVGVTTLFTFHWDITIETIEFAKRICKNPEKNLMVGGILASVVPEAVEKATGIKPYVGCLNVTQLYSDPPMPPPFSSTLIDYLPLDYSILDEIDYQYPESDAYFSYTTRGCVNKCPFCVVPILEPQYKEYISIKDRIQYTAEHFGEKRHLLLLDNNVFASKCYTKIIDEIRHSGFAQNSKYIPPNQLAITIKQLQLSWNDRAYLKKAVILLNEYADSLHGEEYNSFYSLLSDNKLLHPYTAKKANIYYVYEKIKDRYEQDRLKTPLVRFVDFNQGMDARLVTNDKMQKLSEISIRPLRIAFDHWSGRKKYVHAIKLAKDYGITQMSNYLLYNFKDSPIDLYRRLLINIDLCDALGVNIYSFPMKYHPITDEKWFTNRDYIYSPAWSRKSIRTVQAILNSTHGKIGRGRTFFFKAFGRTEEEFQDLIIMPEAFIIKRWDAEICGLTNKWKIAYDALSVSERAFVNDIIHSNLFEPSSWENKSKAVSDLLNYYLIKRDDIPSANEESKQIAILEFESRCPTKISSLCRRLLNDDKS